MDSELNYGHSPRQAYLFSVIIPVYNDQSFLVECLDSIDCQSEVEYEVILIDDGSTDNSAAICDEYKRRHMNHCIIIHKENEGPLIARLMGLSKASGEYLIFVDADDLLMPDSLRLIKSAIVDTNADIIQYGFTRSYRRFLKQKNTNSASTSYRLVEKVSRLKLLCTGVTQNSLCSKAIRKSCLRGEYFYHRYKGLKYGEDFLQMLDIYDRADTFCVIDRILYYYRPGSGITATYEPHFHWDTCRNLDVAELYAQVWEKQFHCNCLLAGLAAQRLDSASYLAEYYGSIGDTEKLHELRLKPDIQRCMSTPRSMTYLSIRARFALCALKRESLRLLKTINTVNWLVRRVKVHVSSV